MRSWEAKPQKDAEKLKLQKTFFHYNVFHGLANACARRPSIPILVRKKIGCYVREISDGDLAD